MRRPSGPSHLRVQAVLAPEAGQALVVGHRRLQLVFGIELADVDQPAVGQAPRAGHRLVVRVVDGEVLVHQVVVAVAAAEEAGEMDAHVVVGPSDDAQGVPRGVEGLLDE